jgi:hypothetical protein
MFLYFMASNIYYFHWAALFLFTMRQFKDACKFTSAVLNTSTAEVNLPASLPVSEALRP